ncbi:MAG: zinc ribbon domain-containing protein [Thermoproteota archaeon]|nr:zinc ribbon domain-containing protein [Candidatus Brockarchaeota archaeon]
MNKANVLAAGVLLIAVGLYFQTIQNPFGELMDEATYKYYKYLMTAIFWTGIIVVVVSILIRPRRRIIAPAEAARSEAVEESGQKEAAYREPEVEASYTGEEVETIEKEEAGLEQAYEEAPAEESYGPIEEEALEKEEKPEKVSEIIGFCPRCGAPVSEGMRYCRKCGLKLK